MPILHPVRRKISLRLSLALHDAVQEAVRLGLAPNQNTFIEDSIRMREREVRHARMRHLAAEAMADPDFVVDMRGVMAEFQYVDSEAWPEGLGDDSKATGKGGHS